jgi:hypothetical protein
MSEMSTPEKLRAEARERFSHLPFSDLTIGLIESLTPIRLAILSAACDKLAVAKQIEGEGHNG